MRQSTLHECVRLARQHISEKNLEVLANSERHDLLDFHFTLGMSVRNAWLYPKDSVLRDKLVGIGFVHQDDMSTLITEALWLELNGRELDLPTLRELVGWSWRSRYDRKEEEARLQDLLGTADS